MTRVLPALAALVFGLIGLLPLTENPRGDFETVNIVAFVIAGVILVGEVVYAKSGRDLWR